MAESQANINNWWGKLLGSGLGWVAGGPWGVLVGLLVGHAFDRRQAGITRFRRQGSDPARFPDTVFQVMGHLAKIDGRVSEAEIGAARQAIGQLGLDEAGAERVKQCFNEGKQKGFPLEAALRRARTICGRRTDRARIFVELLAQIALADGHVRAAEQRVLEKACYHLGFKRPELNQVIAIISAQQSRSSSNWQPRRPPPVNDVAAAYAVLGISKTSNDEAVKKAYRRLMSQHHPDKLAARGLSDEMLKLAEEKTVEIRAAYDRIREARGMR
ncbi:DnaJ like chaperone protein [Natronospira proteinivora]|uniref:DnaJ like chaperone protein n=1 Tax=Natronospira proteinivora TaxID=1807133 RepID=A0ABT1G8C5_9GAMM|nr:co-chaperone DjlA [Natronospira proteinivora]MCP1727550.1 DnaJ like chaperone protein [Natronospira proteinivora]